MRKYLFLLTSALALGICLNAFAVEIVCFENDFSTLDYVAVRDPVTGPYLYETTGPGAMGDFPDGSSGYMVMDYNFLPGPPALDLSDCVVAQPSTLSLTVRADGPELVTGDPMGFWLRVYSGIWDEVGETWMFTAWANYSVNANVNEGWTVNTKDLANPDELGEGFDWSSIYKMRLDYVFWDVKYSPGSFGMKDLSITCVPEPGTMMLFGTGLLSLLVLLRRKRK